MKMVNRKRKVMKNVFMVLLIGIFLVGFSGSVFADCTYCNSESNCEGKYSSCEDFEDYTFGTNFWCDGTAPGGGSIWHDLRAMPDTSAGNCINAYGIINNETKFNGNYSFESRVNSVGDGSSTGYHGGYVFINDNVEGVPNELWSRYYIYVPSANYYTGTGGHCNHHNFLSDGVGAYPSIDFRHFFWQQDNSGDPVYYGNSDYSSSGYTEGNDGKLYIGIHSYGSGDGGAGTGERFEAGSIPGDGSASDGPPAFAISDHFDEWICIEWYLNDISKRMRLWINGVEYVDTANRMTYSKIPIGFQIGQYNCLNNDVGTTWKMYVDNIVISTTGYIGPLAPEDTTPPTRSSPFPTTNLSSGTTQTTISLTTDENANCRYSETSGIDYSSMIETFDNTDSTAHSELITGLSDGDSKTYYVRCQDESNNQNTDDFEISFSIASSTTYSISNFINLVADWLKSEPPTLESDVNGDGIVNTRDLGIMMSHWE